MEKNDLKIEKEKEKDKEYSPKILRYPFNGRSSYLIDKFYIIGFNQTTLSKYLYDDENLKKILSETKLNKENSSDSDLQKFTLDINPIVLNEFTSDFEKETMMVDTIMEMMLPKKLNLYFSEIKKVYSKSPEKKDKKRETLNLENNIDDNEEASFNEDFCFYDESEYHNYKKELISKSYNNIFSSNAQSGKNSKKSINGFSYVFYKKIKKNKRYLNKIYSFYIPIVFCIISEFPFYNSFYQLCKKIEYLFSCNDIRIPLEVILYDIIKMTPSPLNADVYLNLNYIQNLNNKDNDSIRRERERSLKDMNTMNDIKEEENENDANNDSDDKEFDSNNKNDKNSINNNFILLKSVQFEDKKTENIKNELISVNPEKINKNFDKLKSMEFKTSMNADFRKTKKTVNMKKKIKEINSSLDIRTIAKINPEFQKKIKFDFLTGYPLIQYNLAKVLMQTLSPIDVIVIFFYTFLEKDVIFFSKDLEFLSLTINSYFNLNFPLNDEKYYFNNVSVSYDNFINQNSTFVGVNYTTVIGINDSYNPKYQTNPNVKIKEHCAVDLDNGKIYKIEDKNNKEKSQKDKQLFHFIKNVCKNKENKNDKNILQREIEILHLILQNIHTKMNDEEKSFYYNIYKLNSYISYDDSIKKLNIQIQDYFYRLINNISMYFYQNLSIKAEGDNTKLKKKKIDTSDNKEEENDINVIFREDYKDEDIYTKEELYFLDELTDTMKFESFVTLFIQSYNPIDLYKIPLTFTEEFISFISRKSIIINKKINFLGLIDELYDVDNKKEIIIDLKDILSEYYNKYRNNFNRYIEENEEKKGSDKVKLKINKKSIIKYKSYELDSKICAKYLNILSNISEDDENIFNKCAKNVKENIPKMISVTDIETVIENYAMDTNILSINDLCCVNIIILFALTLRSMKTIENCRDFLGSLFQNFIIFRKYYSIIMSVVYTLYEESIKKKEYKRADDYFYLYYFCINSLRNINIIPNESLMILIKKFNKIINLDSLGKKENETITNKINNNIDINNDEDDKNIKAINIPEEPITSKNLYVIYNLTANGSISEKDLIKKVNSLKNKDDEIISTKGVEYMQPRIKFNNGIRPHESFIFSQRLMLSFLWEQYKNYIIDFDENKLKAKINLDACLNILLFMRNSKRFSNDDDVTNTVKNIFYIFLNQIESKAG